MDIDAPETVALTISADAWLDVLGEPDEPPDALAAWTERVVRAVLDRATDVAWLKRGEVSLLLTNDREIRELNATYRQKDRATNVLSFPSLDLRDGNAVGPRGPGAVVLGDVVISHERLMGEAVDLEKTPVDHFAHLLVHGTLHLLGYDHDHDERAEVMEAHEAEILKMLGFAPPYVSVDDVSHRPAVLSVVS
jgi:probable rRNA maturation factor